MTLHDPVHSLRFSSVTQSVPKDWLEVEYEQSDWVEERLVDVLRVGVEVIAQDVGFCFHLDPITLSLDDVLSGLAISLRYCDFAVAEVVWVDSIFGN